MTNKESKRIVVMGGGTGTFTVLSGLKIHPVELTAIVSVADNGGSTGILRDELGVLPPGDIRQCLVALSSGDDLLRRLFNYRFHEGSLAGHNFGNLFLSALEKITGDSLSAIREAHRILNVKGRVIPVSAFALNLFAELENGTVIEGEHAIDEPAAERASIRRCFLSPSVSANSEALRVIREADVIVMGPGDLYTSLMPILLVEGVSKALAASNAKKIYIMNLATKHGETDDFTAKRFCDVVSIAIAPAKLDSVIVNSSQPESELLERYVHAGEHLVKDDLDATPYRVLRVPLLTSDVSEAVRGDALRRSLLRHDSSKLAAAIMGLIDSAN